MPPKAKVAIKVIGKAKAKAKAKVPAGAVAVAVGGKATKGSAKGWDEIQQGKAGMGKLGAMAVMDHLKHFQSFSLGNPRGYWEYSDEDFVGIMSTLALKKGGANTHKACSHNVISRYRALLSMGQV